ncbi:hypothetical protein [Streptomyces somaliensis]|uniref:hypothetical protein n=1 Tax=Streptomyces somaliensis TaxID=78355 RepID=UPI0034E97E27|nr:hypothetical protein [Streptomyces somaliensis]
MRLLTGYADLHQRQGRHEVPRAGHTALRLPGGGRLSAPPAAVRGDAGAVPRDRGDHQRGWGRHRRAGPRREPAPDAAPARGEGAYGAAKRHPSRAGRPGAPSAPGAP